MSGQATEAEGMLQENGRPQIETRELTVTKKPGVFVFDPSPDGGDPPPFQPMPLPGPKVRPKRILAVRPEPDIDAGV
jgi:hypothetical protein